MTFIPVFQHLLMASGSPPGKPPWLRLEQDEVFVRSYGGTSADCARKPLAATIIGLVGFAVAGATALALLSRRAAPDIGGGAGDSSPWVAVMVVTILVLNIAFVIVIKAARRRQTEAFLTTKMLIVRHGKACAGVRLTDLTAIQPGTGADRNTLIVRARTAQTPVALLRVDNPAAALAELTAYAKAAGARL
jgi:hypothetical protein